MTRTVGLPSGRWARLASDRSVHMVAAAALAITATNAFPGLHVERLWSHSVAVGWGEHTARLDISSVTVEGLMTAFFLCVGLEIRREIAFGALRSRRAALLPVMCAAAGMLAPAFVYGIIAGGGDSSAGWAIPTATDAAVAVGILALVAPGLSTGARTFLLTLAVADDIGGIIIICFWYSHGAVLLLALAAVGISAVAALAVRAGVVRFIPALALLVPAWVLMHEAGISPAVIGAVFGLLVPMSAVPRGRAVRADVELLLGRLAPFVAALVLPLFAAVSASVPIEGADLQVGLVAGVAVGLCLGKPLGIFGAAWLLVRFRVGERPAGTTTRELLGVAILGGVGFTVSLYIAELSFADGRLQQTATLGVMVGSAAAMVLGALYFRAPRARSSRRQRAREEATLAPS